MEEGIKMEVGRGIEMGRWSDIRANGDSTLRKRRLRSDSAAEDGTKSKSPRRCINGGLNCTENGIIEKESGDNKVVKSRELLVKKLEDEKKRVLEFCKQCIEQEKAGSLYVCGCPGTGKSLMERVKDSLVDWAQGALPYIVFQPQALELCARKVAAASGDMRKALCICRSAIEMLQAELRESACNLDFSLAENGYSNQQTTPAYYALFCCEAFPWGKEGYNYRRGILSDIVFNKISEEYIVQQLIEICELNMLRVLIEFISLDIILVSSAVKLFRGGKKDTTIGEVRVDHMAIALSKTYRSPIMDTIQSLPQHQQIILCSAVKLFRGGKKDTTIGEGLLKLGQSREDKLRRVTLKVDEADVAFALQGIRVFRDCLNACL
ncbi:hypothetical protein TEA_025659 [Camellia sinensis var. sinensis]|uniref:Uncharacterized protein n=1 Tax=Camellia sinensis var. sinensis TaxID=542762 RepID=A0A4S4F1B8_CAMSN|nr:hypothetical protein TEA_025659 [Camellia sinensis var. sinensis]